MFNNQQKSSHSHRIHHKNNIENLAEYSSYIERKERNGVEKELKVFLLFIQP